MLKVKVKQAETEAPQTYSFEIKEEKDTLFLNEQAFDWDIVEIKSNTFHIIKDHKSYTAEVLKADLEAKSFLIQINGNKYELELKDKFDLLLEKMGMDKSNSSKISEVKAPMPGLILEIKIQEGQSVQKGDALMILEAMKMENVLKSPTEGLVKKIKVKKGDNVERNQVLIQFE